MQNLASNPTQTSNAMTDYYQKRAVFDAKNIKAITDFLTSNGVISLGLSYCHRFSNDEGSGGCKVLSLYVQKPGGDLTSMPIKEASTDPYFSNLFSSKLSVDTVNQKYHAESKQWLTVQSILEVDVQDALTMMARIESDGMEIIPEDFMKSNGAYSHERESDDEGGETSTTINEGFARYNLSSKALTPINSDGSPVARISLGRMSTPSYQRMRF